MSVEKYRLHAMPSAQCHVVIQRDASKTVVELISYNTGVLRAVYENDNLRLYCSGTYSATTSRHINRFTKEFFGENLYSDCKKAISNSDTSVMLFNGLYYMVFNICVGCYDFEKLEKTFFNTIYKYENDAFGIGQVKKYRGHY